MNKNYIPEYIVKVRKYKRPYYIEKEDRTYHFAFQWEANIVVWILRRFSHYGIWRFWKDFAYI